jgi:hypothetical protein
VPSYEALRHSSGLLTSAWAAGLASCSRICTHNLSECFSLLSANANNSRISRTCFSVRYTMTNSEGNGIEPGHQPTDGGAAFNSNGVNGGNDMVDVKFDAPSSPKKRARTSTPEVEGAADTSFKRVKGVAPIKAEYAALPT